MIAKAIANAHLIISYWLLFEEKFYSNRKREDHYQKDHTVHTTVQHSLIPQQYLSGASHKPVSQ